MRKKIPNKIHFKVVLLLVSGQKTNKMKLHLVSFVFKCDNLLIILLAHVYVSVIVFGFVN